MKTAIVIGGSGFLGGHVIKALRKDHVDIFAVVHKRTVEVAADRIIPGGIKALNKDLLDRINPDYIIHCARPTFARFRRTGRLIAARVAARNNRWLIKQLTKSAAKPLLVFASGSLMYGNSKKPHTENSELFPISYAKQYYQGEIPILRACEQNSYPVCILRLPWLLGPGSWFKWFYLDTLKGKNAIPSFGITDNTMEIIDVRDAALLLSRYASSGSRGIYNIPGKEPMTAETFTNAVAQAFETTVRHYSEIFPKGIEREAMEAFTSDISLNTDHPDLIMSFDYTLLEESLQDIRSNNFEMK